MVVGTYSNSSKVWKRRSLHKLSGIRQTSFRRDESGLFEALSSSPGRSWFLFGPLRLFDPPGSALEGLLRSGLGVVAWLLPLRELVSEFTWVRIPVSGSVINSKSIDSSNRETSLFCWVRLFPTEYFMSAHGLTSPSK